MVIQAGISLLLCFAMKDSFRKERSLAYINAKKRAMSRAQSRAHSAQLSRVASHSQSHTNLNMKSSTNAADVKPHAGLDAMPLHDDDAEKVRDQPQPQPPVEDDERPIKLTISDVNPLGPAWQVMKQRTNAAILAGSGQCNNQSTCYVRALITPCALRACACA